MAGAFVGEAGAGSSSSSQSTTGTITVTATANNLLVAILSMRGVSLTGDIVDDTGNWTIIQKEFGSRCMGVLAHRIASGTTADDVDFSWTTQNELWTVTVAEYSGLEATIGDAYDNSVEDTTYVADASRASGASITITGSPTAQPGLAISGFHGADERDGNVAEMSIASGGYTIDSAEINKVGAVPTAFIASRTFTDTGAKACEWDTNRADNWQGYATLAFYLEPGGGGGLGIPLVMHNFRMRVVN